MTSEQSAMTDSQLRSKVGELLITALFLYGVTALWALFILFSAITVGIIVTGVVGLNATRLIELLYGPVALFQDPETGLRSRYLVGLVALALIGAFNVLLQRRKKEHQGNVASKLGRLIGKLNPVKAFTASRCAVLAGEAVRSRLIYKLELNARRIAAERERREKQEMERAKLAAAEKERLEREEARRKEAKAAQQRANIKTLPARNAIQTVYGGGSISRGPVKIRMPRDADDFETVCAEFSKMIGFADARRTPKGPDGGIDVISRQMVGQCKFHPSQKVTGHDVRALFGSMKERGASQALFFHYGPGYSQDALTVAKKLGVKLYEVDAHRGMMRPVP